jgi:hypothetical protein
MATGEIATLGGLDIGREALETLADADDEWMAVDGGWVNAEAGLAVYDPGAFDDPTGSDDVSQEGDPMTNGHDLDPTTGEGVCEATGETFEAETMGDLAGDCPHCGEPLSHIGEEAAVSQEAAFGVDVFRIVQSDDADMDIDGDLMGVGVDFPNAGVYVDWRIDAWPDDEQLAEPHVSDYGSVDDLEQATGGVVEYIQTVEAVDN